MMDVKDVKFAAANAGFVLVRQKKHLVYRNDTLNRTFVVSATPSDTRAGHSMIKDLSRLTGKSKRELLARPIKAKRNRAVACSQATAVPAVPVPESIVAQAETAARPVSRKEIQMLRRMEKHEGQREAKLAKQRSRLQELASAMNERFLREMRTAVLISNDAKSEIHHIAALSIYREVKRMGFHDAEIMVAECRAHEKGQGILVVRAGRWFVDYFAGVVCDRPAWALGFSDGQTTEIEVYGTLNVEDDGKSVEMSE